ncbi:bifunctional diaminohydroxyphosphoribosylaminopyrimidine deaminase/5-amino-6-(5-phosphoribosylamino)uracil reductase RibD [Candidatus Margulisiibacteriota bacterium]
MTDTSFSKFEKKLMQKLLRIAERKKGISNPNPVTAAAIVKGEQILSIGSHNKFGTPHAEAIALKNAGPKARGAALYVNLEPCTHFGNNPPCTDLIIEAGITEVVYAVKDPNPLVSRQPADKVLKKAGIKVRSGLQEDEAFLLNEVFFKNQVLGLPFVTAKIAMSLDGKIALQNGESKYLTAVTSRKVVHKLRRETDAMIIGIGTILKDNPSLNVRYNLAKGYKNPVKIILDSKAEIPITATVFNENPDTDIIIATSKQNIANPKFRKLKKNIRIWGLDLDNKGRIDWDKLLEKAFAFGIGSVLIEGGQKVYTSALENNIIDKLDIFIAPKVLAGEKSLAPFAGQGISSLAKAYEIKDMKVKKISPDILVSGYLRHPNEWVPKK